MLKRFCLTSLYYLYSALFQNLGYWFERHDDLGIVVCHQDPPMTWLLLGSAETRCFGIAIYVFRISVSRSTDRS